jgi:hypothetical protein
MVDSPGVKGREVEAIRFPCRGVAGEKVLSDSRTINLFVRDDKLWVPVDGPVIVRGWMGKLVE